MSDDGNNTRRGERLEGSSTPLGPRGCVPSARATPRHTAQTAQGWGEGLPSRPEPPEHATMMQNGDQPLDNFGMFEETVE